MTTNTADNEPLVRDLHRQIPPEDELTATSELLAEGYVEHNPVISDGGIDGRDETVSYWATMDTLGMKHQLGVVDLR